MLTTTGATYLGRTLRVFEKDTSISERAATIFKDKVIASLKLGRTAAVFNGDIVKHVEALAGFDQLINEWLSKLEHTENRRQRIRQKLLEHIAAALVLDVLTGVREEVTANH